ncbi:MAG: hypothetical protein HY661_07030 [Betaproteobacteria bacterium]|nr:hypothetical protein [Betaproteobacteria bacterium]
MKTLQRTTWETRLHRVEADLKVRVRTLFGQFPELASVSVHDLSGFSDGAERSAQDADSLIVEIVLSRTVRSTDFETIMDLVSSEIVDFVSEEPDAMELLRGRTFARTLH